MISFSHAHHAALLYAEARRHIRTWVPATRVTRGRLNKIYGTEYSQGEVLELIRQGRRMRNYAWRRLWGQQ